MIWLVLAMCCSVIVAMLFKYAEQKHIPLFVFLTVNYAIASATALWGSGFKPAVDNTRLLGLGLLLGILFVCCFVLLMASMKRIGMVIPVSLMRLSAVIPTVASMLIYFERLDLVPLGGVVLAFGILPLASKRRIRRTEIRKLFGEGVGWGLGLFVAFGLTEFLLKVMKETAPAANSFSFLAIIFPTAFFITLSTAIGRKEQPTAFAIVVGLILGITNMFSAYFFFRALGELPGVVVYPINGIGIIMLSSVAGIIVWKERLAVRNIVFLLLAAVALVMMY